jgi:hypothetical protein
LTNIIDDLFWIYFQNIIQPEFDMGSPAQNKALKTYRQKIELVRFEVMTPESDRNILREVAISLTKGGTNADKIRGSLKDALSDQSETKGSIYLALRRSPLVGSELKLKRSRSEGRKIKI